MPDLFVSLVALIQHVAWQQHSLGCECSRRWRFCNCGDGNKRVCSSQHCSDRARYGFTADSNVWPLISKTVLRTCLHVLSMKHGVCCCWHNNRWCIMACFCRTCWLHQGMERWREWVFWATCSNSLEGKKTKAKVTKPKAIHKPHTKVAAKTTWFGLLQLIHQIFLSDHCLVDNLCKLSCLHTNYTGHMFAVYSEIYYCLSCPWYNLNCQACVQAAICSTQQGNWESRAYCTDIGPIQSGSCWSHTSS